MSANIYISAPLVALPNGFSVAFHSSVEDLYAAIPSSFGVPNLFLQAPYLTALEENPPEGMRFLFLLFYKNEKIIGLAACQILHFKGDKSLNNHENERTAGFFSAMSYCLKTAVASRVEFDTLICGSLLLTGEHGFWLPGIPVEKAHKIVENALVAAQHFLNENSISVTATLLKDYFQSSPYLVKSGYNEFVIQPNMMMQLPKEWNNFDDYLLRLHAKARTRARRAFKKLDGVVKKNLSLANLRTEKKRLYQLYQNIATEAGFNTIYLHPDYLQGLKQHLPEEFQLTGYYLHNQLIAFFSTIKNGDELEAHFLGYDKNLNYDRQLYLNMLYDIIAAGIESRAKCIIFARTASEIKSSVGAVAHEMFCYLRHHKPLTNRILGTVFDYLNPVQPWQPRHPFKD